MKIIQNVLYKINQCNCSVSVLNRKERNALYKHAQEKNDKVLLGMILSTKKTRYEVVGS